MKDYIAIPKTTFEAYKISQEHILTEEDIVKLMVYKKLIKKFIQQKAISIQFDIGMGLWKENTFVGLKVVEELVKIAEEIGNIDKVLKKYEDEQKQKEDIDKE